MNKINKILEELLAEIAIIEMEYYKSALDYYSTVFSGNQMGAFDSKENFVKQTNSKFANKKTFIDEDGKVKIVESPVGWYEVNKEIDDYLLSVLLILYAISLNNTLEENERNQQLVNMEEQIRKIQAKKYISVKEFTEIYGDSKKSQEGLRGRLNDPLPYRQKVEGGKITYVVEEVEKWLINQHK